MPYCIKHLNEHEGECVGCVDEVVTEYHNYNKEVIQLEKEYGMSIYSILTELFDKEQFEIY